MSFLIPIIKEVLGSVRVQPTRAPFPARTTPYSSDLGLFDLSSQSSHKITTTNDNDNNNSDHLPGAYYWSDTRHVS